MDLNFDKTEKLSRLICNKSIDYNVKNRFSQTISTIKVTTHWLEALHEIAHWIAAEPDCRNLDNLGLPESSVDESHPLHSRMYSEEVTAQIITKLLFDKYFIGDSRDSNYANYIYQGGMETCEKFGFSKEEYLKNSNKLFNQYTEGISI